jgi:tRNA(fMet)-specific endonuclease VapC
MKYLLDTNICIYIANRRPERVRARFARCRPGDIGMSVVTYMELTYGAWKSNQRENSLIGVHELANLVPVLDLGPAAAEYYALIRSSLEQAGTPIGAFDLLIAAHALSLGLILVTNNVREFKRIKNLRIENWVEEE